MGNPDPENINSGSLWPVGCIVTSMAWKAWEPCFTYAASEFKISVQLPENVVEICLLLVTPSAGFREQSTGHSLILTFDTLTITAVESVVK